MSVRDPWLAVPDLGVLERSGALEAEGEVADLKDHERALVWVDGRLEAVLGPGLHALWTVFRQVKVEVLDARDRQLRREDLPVLLQRGAELLDSVQVEAGHVGMLYLEGRCARRLEPGLHAFWKGEGQVRVVHVDLRETVMDIAGQDIMTADKVTEARKASEAALITRREETAAMRSEANTARLLESNRPSRRTSVRREGADCWFRPTRPRG